MALIKKYINLTVDGDKAHVDQPIFLFQNDKNIDLIFTIKNLKFDFVRNIQKEEDLVESIGATYFRVKVLKPDKDDVDKEYTTDLFKIKDNKIIFNIDDTFIFDKKDEDGNLPSSENDKIGIYKLQIQLYDNANGRITIPEIEFVVLDPIFFDPETDGIIGGDIGDSTIGKPSEITGLVDWVKGQIISAERMNAIHRYLEKLQNQIDNIDLSDKDIYAKNVHYENEQFTNVQDALDSLLYKAPQVNSLSSNIGTTVEMGTMLSSVTFTWSYNKSIVSQSFAGVTLDSNIRTYTYTKGIYNNVTLTLTANDGKNNCSRNISFTYANRIFYGVSDTTTYNVNLLKSLSNTLSNNRNRSFTVNPINNQHIIYAIPSRLGECKFSVNGFEGGFQKVSTIKYTNSQNYTEDYYIYRSDNPNLGKTTVVVN